MIRDSVCSVFVRRLLRANNIYDSSDFDIYGVIIDANNFHDGSVKNLTLPTNSFDQMQTFNFSSIFQTSNQIEIGFILEVFLVRLDKLLDGHQDFSLAPAKKDSNIYFRRETK